MTPREPEEEMLEETRQAIYRAVVAEVDLHEFTPEQARLLVAQCYGVSQTRVLQIEQDGWERLWPTE